MYLITIFVFMKRKRRPSLTGGEEPPKKKSLPKYHIHKQDKGWTPEPPASFKREKSFDRYLKEDLEASDEELERLRSYVPGIHEIEMSGEHIYKKGTDEQKFKRDVEGTLRDYVGVDGADAVISLLESPSRGEYNIHDPAIEFLPNAYKNRPDSDKVLAIIAKNYKEAKEQGLSGEAAYKAAISAYNKDFSQSVKEAKTGDMSYYTEKVYGSAPKRKKRP